MSSAQAIAVWAVSACAVAAILVRPRGIAEWVWSVAGAVAVAAIGAMPFAELAHAVGRGADVYAFLIGILLLAELGRAERVFDWLALRLLRRAGGSKTRLFGLIYLAGTAVTAFLSNDTTVVVLTPAVLAALKRTKDSDPLPYLYVCAFVANAASFLLPVSNPANLVLFGGGLPRLTPWVAAFGLSAVAATVLSFVSLRLACARSLRGEFSYADHEPPAAASTGWAAALLLISAFALVAAAWAGFNVGYTALIAAVISTAVIALIARESAGAALRDTQWTIVPLVAGLFVIVAALDRSGAISIVRALLHHAETLGTLGILYAGAAFTVASNVFNNLPVALASGVALQSSHVAQRVNDATLVAIDLGPNLSVSGSLATLLWLTVLRREGIEVRPLQFLRIGAIVLVPALVASLLLVR